MRRSLSIHLTLTAEDGTVICYLHTVKAPGGRVVALALDVASDAALSSDQFDSLVALQVFHETVKREPREALPVECFCADAEHEAVLVDLPELEA